MRRRIAHAWAKVGCTGIFALIGVMCGIAVKAALT